MRGPSPMALASLPLGPAVRLFRALSLLLVASSWPMAAAAAVVAEAALLPRGALRGAAEPALALHASGWLACSCLGWVLPEAASGPASSTRSADCRPCSHPDFEPLGVFCGATGLAWPALRLAASSAHSARALRRLVRTLAGRGSPRVSAGAVDLTRAPGSSPSRPFCPSLVGAFLAAAGLVLASVDRG